MQSRKANIAGKFIQPSGLPASGEKAGPENSAASGQAGNRDFGFWVRLVAISQIGFLVLAHYGDGWLAPDNPVLVRGGDPAPLKPLSEIARAGRPVADVEDDPFAGTRDDRLREIAGWGGADEEAEAEADWDKELDKESSYPDDLRAFDPAEADESDWGKVAKPPAR